MRSLRILLPCLLAGACVTEPDTAGRHDPANLGTHRGAVLSVAPEAAWAASKSALGELGAVTVDEADRTVRAQWADGSATVRVDPQDAGGTQSILRISARAGGRDAPELADRIQLSIQRVLWSAR